MKITLQKILSIALFWLIGLSGTTINATPLVAPITATPIALSNDIQPLDRLITVPSQYPTIAKDLIENPVAANEILYNNCIAHYTVLNKDLLDIMHSITQDITYWKNQQLDFWRYFIARGPIKWFIGTPQDKEVQGYIHALEQEQKNISYFIGELHNQLFVLKKDKSLPNVVKYLATIDQCLNHRCGHTIAPLVESKDPLGSTIKYFELLKNFKKTTLKNLEMYRKPGHFQRNWLAYTAVGIVAGTAACYFYKNPITGTDIQNIKGQGIDFWHKHFEGPIKNFKKQLTGSNEKDIFTPEEIKKFQESKDFFAQQEAIEEDFKRLEKIGHNMKKINEEINNSTPSNEVKLPYHIGTITNPLIGKTEKAIDKGNNIENGTVEGYIVSVELLKKMYYNLTSFTAKAGLIIANTDGRLKAQDLTLVLLTAIPATLASYLGFVGLKKTYNILTTHNITKPLVEHVGAIERILNCANNGSKMLDAQSFGIVLYRTHQLKYYQAYVPKDHRLTFIQDIQELESPIMSVHQKLETTRRMFRVYDFLNIKS